MSATRPDLPPRVGVGGWLASNDFGAQSSVVPAVEYAAAFPPTDPSGVRPPAVAGARDPAAGGPRIPDAVGRIVYDPAGRRRDLAAASRGRGGGGGAGRRPNSPPGNGWRPG